MELYLEVACLILSFNNQISLNPLILRLEFRLLLLKSDTAVLVDNKLITFGSGLPTEYPPTAEPWSMNIPTISHSVPTSHYR